MLFPPNFPSLERELVQLSAPQNILWLELVPTQKAVGRLGC